MRSLGLYLHIPFCKSKCRYCDFCSFPQKNGAAVEAYLASLSHEIAAYGRMCGAYTVNTVYFGGGTPTYLSAEQLASLLLTVREHFAVSEDAEISTECNPATVDVAALTTLRRAGFDRLSIGAQSLSDGELALLGRAHSAADFRATFLAAREAGFENISVDLMFGIPSQTVDSFRQTLEGLVALGPEHISAYGLKIEEGTPFWRELETLALPNEDEERQMYMDAVDFLAAWGYARYEISNFAKMGYESRHNLRYWEREDYLGMGLAAYSCLGFDRFSNTCDLSSYLSGERVADRETVSAHDALCEAIMLGMRLEKGVNFSALAKIHGDAAWDYQNHLAKYEKGGFVRKTDHGFAFTSEGMYVSNAILSETLDFE